MENILLVLQPALETQQGTKMWSSGEVYVSLLKNTFLTSLPQHEPSVVSQSKKLER